MKVLVLGGDNDGSRIEVNDKDVPQNIILCVKQRIAPPVCDPLRRGARELEILTEHYQLAYLHSGKEKLPVYLFSGEPGENIIPALLAGYRTVKA